MTKECGGIPISQHHRLHSQLRQKHGKANKCENATCTSINPKRFEWALKKGRKYSNNPDDYLQLCPSCHRKYDETEARKKKLSEKNRGRCFHGRERKIKRIDSSGQIKVYESITEAYLANGFKRHTQIMNALTGISKTSGGFVWQYD